MTNNTCGDCLNCVNNNLDSQTDETINMSEVGVIGTILNGRQKYSFEELLSVKKMPILEEITKNLETNFTHERFLRAYLFEKQQTKYKRSDDAWIGVAERLKSLPKVQAEKELLRIRIQKSINKFNKSMLSFVLNELKNLPFDNDHVLSTLIDCIYQAVTLNGAWIVDLAKLCIELNNFQANQIKRNNKFKSDLIDKFISGSTIPEKWKQEHASLRNKELKTIDDLDEINEGLQIMEGKQASILKGCVNFLGHLYIMDFITVDKVQNLLKTFTTVEHELEMEAACIFLNIITLHSQISVKTKKLINSLADYIETRAPYCSMRVRFFITKLQKLKENNWKPVTNGSEAKATKIVNFKQSQFVPQRTKAADNSKNWSKPSEKPVITVKTVKMEQISSVQQANSFIRHKKQKPPARPKIVVTSISKPNSTQNSFTNTLKPQIEEIKAEIFPIVENFLIHYDIPKFIIELNETKMTGYGEEFVNLTLTSIIERVSVDFLSVGKLLLSLINQNYISKVEFVAGFSRFLAIFNELIVDVPILPSRVGCCLIPLITTNILGFNEYYSILKEAKVENPQNVLSSLLVEMERHLGKASVSHFLTKYSNTSEGLYMTAYNHLLTMDEEALYVDLDEQKNLIIIEGNNVKATILNQDLEKNQKIASTFAKLVHYCCPPGILSDVDNYIAKTVNDHQELLNFIMITDGNAFAFFESLKNTMNQRKIFLPSFLRKLIEVLMKNSILKSELFLKLLPDLSYEPFEYEFASIQFEIDKS